MRKAHRPVGNLALSVFQLHRICAVLEVVMITARSNGVRGLGAHLNIRRWWCMNPSADDTCPVRVQLRAQRVAHIEPDLGRLRQGRIKTVE